MKTQDASQSGRSRVLPARIRLCLGRFTAGDGRKMGQLFLRLGERRDRYARGRGKILRDPSELLRPGNDPGRSLSRQVVFDPAVACPYLPCRARISVDLVQRGRKQMSGHSGDGLSVGEPGPPHGRARRDHRFAVAHQTGRPDEDRTGEWRSAAAIEL